MKHFTILFLVLTGFFLNKQVAAQTFQWAGGWGAGFDDAVTSVATDATGNVYALSVFTGTVDFNPGPGTYTIASKGANDVCITKLDANGNFLWAKQLGGGGNDGAGTLTVDAAGNVYSTGFYIYTADFDPGTGTANLTSTGSSNEIFISKLDANGNYLWAKSIGGTGSDQGMGIHVDNTGNVYTTGFFNTTADFDPSSSTYTLSTPGGNCIFVSKLDASGNFVWAKAMGGAGGSFQNYGAGITTDALGNVYTTGSFIKTVDFDPGAATYTLACNGGFDQDIFISKLDAMGNFGWAVSMGGGTYDNGFSIACDATGDVYVTGTFAGITDFDAAATSYTLDGGSAHDAFVTKYSAAGNFVWAKQIGSSSAERISSIFIDANNIIYLCGIFDGTVDFDPNAGTANLTAAGTYNSVFVDALDISGNYINATVLNTQRSYDQPPSITVDATGNIVVGGAFYGTSDFDPGVGTYTLSASSASYSDGFVAKLGTIVTGIHNQTAVSGNVTLFPNPASMVLNVRVKGIEFSKNTTMTLLNNLGQEVKQLVLSHEQSAISLEGLTTGIYFYQISNEGKALQTGKLIIEHGVLE